MHRPRPLGLTHLLSARVPRASVAQPVHLWSSCAPPQEMLRARDTQQPSGRHAFLVETVTVHTGPYGSRLSGYSTQSGLRLAQRSNSSQLGTGQTVSVCDCVSACVYVVVFETIVLI